MQKKSNKEKSQIQKDYQKQFQGQKNSISASMEVQHNQEIDHLKWIHAEELDTLKNLHARKLFEKERKNIQAQAALEMFKEEDSSLNQALHDTHKTLLLQLNEIYKHYWELEKIFEQAKIQEKALNLTCEAPREIIKWQSKHHEAPNSILSLNEKCQYNDRFLIGWDVEGKVSQ